MLTKSQIEKLKEKEGRYEIADGNGLYIEVMPNGKKYWRLKFKHKKQRICRTLGEYPILSLKEARVEVILQRQHIQKNGVGGAKFEEYAAEWIKKQEKVLAKETITTILSRLDTHILPQIGNIPINELTSQQIKDSVRKLEEQEKIPSAKRVLSIIGRVLRYAITKGETISDPTKALIETLDVCKTKHFSTITTKREVQKLIQNIKSYENIITRNALMFMAYTFCRTNELRFAKWEEFDLESNVWRIPAERMKARRTHIVPLARQSIEILSKQRIISEDYVFPSQRNIHNPMSENCLLKAMRHFYTKEEMTPHGLRATASTLLNESGYWSENAIELQLAHTDSNQVRASYNYAKLLPERTSMVQWYADLIDALEKGEKEPPKPNV